MRKKMRAQTPPFDRLVATAQGQREIMARLSPAEQKELVELDRELRSVRSPEVLQEGLAEVLERLRAGYRKLVAFEARRRRQQRKAGRRARRAGHALRG